MKRQDEAKSAGTMGCSCLGPEKRREWNLDEGFNVISNIFIFSHMRVI